MARMESGVTRKCTKYVKCLLVFSFVPAHRCIANKVFNCCVVIRDRVKGEIDMGNYGTISAQNK